MSRFPRSFIAVFALLSSCGESKVAIDIPFEMRFGAAAISCTSREGGPALSDMRFFVHDVSLLDADGQSQSLEFSADGHWQSADIALIDLEDGQGTCRNGTLETNARISGWARGREFRGLRFSIAVPRHLNHADPLLADAPLTNTTMHWHWRSGYKFLRAGVSLPDDGHWIHVGSARCTGAIGALARCDSENRIDLELLDFVPGRDAVILDLQRLFSRVDLSDGVPSDCSSGPAEESCAPTFAELGIDFSSGQTERPANFAYAARRK